MSSMTLQLDRNRGKFRVFLVLVIFAGLQFLLTLHLRMNVAIPKATAQENVEAYNPELFKVMSFGQTPAIIDWMWLNLLMDPRITHVKPGSHPQIYYTLDLITTLDPAFMEAYVNGAMLLSVIRNDGPGALALLLKGEAFRTHELNRYSEFYRKKYWYSEWQMPLLLAYVNLFDMNNMPSAAKAFEVAAAIPGAPAYLQVLRKQLTERGGEYKVGIRLLGFMLRSKDPELRAHLLQEAESLKVGYYIFILNDRFADFVAAQKTKRRYRQSGEDVRTLWGTFRAKNGIPDTDPWGGQLQIDSHGRIATTTKHEKVFGLE